MTENILMGLAVAGIAAVSWFIGMRQGYNHGKVTVLLFMKWVVRQPEADMMKTEAAVDYWLKLRGIDPSSVTFRVHK